MLPAFRLMANDYHPPVSFCDAAMFDLRRRRAAVGGNAELRWRGQRRRRQKCPIGAATKPALCYRAFCP
jgi:hypothetical protein